MPYDTLYFEIGGVELVRYLLKRVLQRGSEFVEMEAKQLRDSGNQAFGARKYMESIEWYTKSLFKATCSNDRLLALSNRSQVQLKLGNFLNALQDATEALREDQNHVKSIFRMARALYGLGEPDSAVNILSKLIKMNGQASNLAELQIEAKGLLKHGRMLDLELRKQKMIEEVDSMIQPVNVRRLGSGKYGLPLVSVTCEMCENEAAANGVACGDCGLVKYCSKQCYLSHKEQHAKVCGICKPTTWRKNSSSGDEEMSSIFLWGNMPAVSIYAANSNDTCSSKDINLCFVASGDLRDFITTVSQIPDSYKGKVRIVVNDFNCLVVMRNFLILEILRLYGKEGVDCAIAVWYSDSMTEEQSKACCGAGWDALKRSGYIERSAETITACLSYSALNGPPLVASFKGTSSSTLSLNVDDKSLGALMKYMESRLEGSDVKDKRLNRCMSYYTSTMKLVSPYLKPSWWQFHVHNGLMLPFSYMLRTPSSTLDISAPNKFLLDAGKEWIQCSAADPLYGWKYKDIENGITELGLPKHDIYGGLFFHVRKTLLRLVKVMENVKVDIELRCEDARLLAEEMKLRKQKFNSISTSNIADVNYVGLKRVITDWGCLLEENGTLITLQMQWAVPIGRVYVTSSEVVRAFKIKRGVNIDRMVKLELKKRGMSCKGNAELVLAWLKRTDIIYEEYLRKEGVHQVGVESGVKARVKHVCVPPRCGVPIDASGKDVPMDFICDEKEIEFNVSTRRSFMERYVEWTTLPKHV